MPKLNLGAKAPDFVLPDSNGKKVKLSDFKGQTVVLYFYPRDNTPGCTKEACDFRDATKKFSKKGAVIIGVSPDTAKSHEKFQSIFDLPFVLLADEDRKVAKLYGVYKKKNMYGKSVMGIERSTFVIDRSGKLAWEQRKVKVDGHVDSVLQFLK